MEMCDFLKPLINSQIIQFFFVYLKKHIIPGTFYCSNCSFLTPLYESTESYYCHFDVSMSVGITLKSFMSKLLCYGQDTVRGAILYRDRSCSSSKKACDCLQFL